jgi:glycosyltransferase A (GT-A) superfamily protein (DUF2064 family)
MKSVVMLFANHPLPALPPDAEPAPLALALLKDTLRTLADVDAEVLLFLDPAQDKEQARALLGKGSFKLANALGRNQQARQRNAFRLVFARGYERALLLANAMPDLPAHQLQSALDGLGWRCCCLGPVPDADGKPDQIYAMGFDFEGYTTDALDLVDYSRPGVFERVETLVLFHERKVKVLPPYRPVAALTDAAELAGRCAGTRFAILPSVRLAAGKD